MHSENLGNRCALKNNFALLPLFFSRAYPCLLLVATGGVGLDEARLSPQAGRLIRQLLEEDSDPMLSPASTLTGRAGSTWATEVPPSPPNSHPFMRVCFFVLLRHRGSIRVTLKGEECYPGLVMVLARL